MESSERFENKLSNYRDALSNFSKSLSINLSNHSEIEVDTIKSGQIQKFEICVELCCKAIKEYLSYQHKIKTISPKNSVKELFLIKIITEEEYELLLGAIEDRNKLSHIYSEMFMEEIHSRLENYLQLFNRIKEKISE